MAWAPAMCQGSPWSPRRRPPASGSCRCSMKICPEVSGIGGPGGCGGGWFQKKSTEQRWLASCVLRPKKVFAIVTRRRHSGQWQQLGEGAEVRTSWSISLCQLVLCGSVAQSCLTICDPMDCSIAVFPVLLYLPAAAALLQSCLTLCDPIDGSPPGSSVPGSLQARILQWVSISFFKA